jgi:hypothetical protein
MPGNSDSAGHFNVDKADLKYLFDRADSQIRVELDLIGQRMAALCISQSFLVAAFVALIRLGPNDGNTFAYYRAGLLPVLPLMGLSLSTILGCSLLAADSIIKKRKEQRDEIKKQLAPQLKTGDLSEEHVLAHVPVKSWQHRLGQWLIWMAWIMAAFWIFTIWLYIQQRIQGPC